MIFGMIFGFSLYTMPLQVSQIIYFGRRLGGLRDLGASEDSKVCYY